MGGDGQAVLIRSAIPINGQALMMQRRGRTTHIADGYRSGASREATSRVGIRVGTDRLWRWSLAS